MDRFIGYLLLACCLHAVVGKDCPSKIVNALCKRDPAPNYLTVDVKFDLQSSPQGEFAVEPPENSDNCPIVFDSNVYSMTSQIDLNSRDQIVVVSQSGCGVTYDARTRAYTWKLMYYENAERNDTDNGCNRLYTVTCNPDNMVDLVITAQITVSTPDLNEDVIPYQLDIEFFLEASNENGLFDRLDQDSVVPVQTPLKLVLLLKSITNDITRVSSLAALSCVVDDNTAFTNPRIFHDNFGCPGGDLAGTQGFHLVDSQDVTVSRRETGVFPAFLFDGNSQIIAFRTEFDGCPGEKDTDPYCNDPCLFSTSRKKRSVQENELRYVTATVRVVPKSEADKVSGDNNSILFAAVGACIGLCVLLIVMLTVMVCVVRRRRDSKAGEKKVPHNVFVNDIKMAY